MIEPSPSQSPSVAKQILVGQLVVMLPVLTIILAGCFLGYALFAKDGSRVGLVAGSALAWLYWSLTIPRWRAWALRSGANPEALQKWGVATGLVWPRGWIFEKTELPPRK
jgi:hypothetical protein